MADRLRPGEGGDIEPYAARAERIAMELIAEARAGGFRSDEIEDVQGRLVGLITTYLATKPAFDISGFGAAPPDD